VSHFYWERHPDGPFVTLIAVATTYLHPEANEPEALRRRAGRATESGKDEEMRVFKAELREAIAHPERLPGGELSRNVQWEFGGSTEVFLRLLWWYLYRDEPASAQPARTAHGDTGAVVAQQPGTAATGAGKGDLIRTTAITSSLFEGDWIPPGAEGVVLDILPKQRCLVDLTLVTPAEDEVVGVYGAEFGDGDYGEGEFPLVVLSQGDYEVIRASDRG
jgi:hypothetical protein